MVGVTCIAAILLTLVASSGRAQEHPHGANGQKLGTVHFATSCKVAQEEFNRAVALLHSFQFSCAIEGFNEVLGEDPTCGIAYWGIALSDWSNPFARGAKDKSQLQAGRENAERGKTVGAKAERERAYIATVGKLYKEFESTAQRTRLLAYRDAMGEVAGKYPDDHEAQIFYALAVAASEDPADKTHAGQLKAGAILEKLFEEEPTHAGQSEATLKKEPGRYRALYGTAHAAQLSGNREASHKYFLELLAVCSRADKAGRSELIEAQRAILQN